MACNSAADILRKIDIANAEHAGGEPDILGIKIIDRKELAVRPEITELEKKAEPQVGFSNGRQRLLKVVCRCEV